jgi:hypothetical protein
VDGPSPAANFLSFYVHIRPSICIASVSIVHQWGAGRQQMISRIYVCNHFFFLFPLIFISLSMFKKKFKSCRN